MGADKSSISHLRSCRSGQEVERHLQQVVVPQQSESGVGAKQAGEQIASQSTQREQEQRGCQQRHGEGERGRAPQADLKSVG